MELNELLEAIRALSEEEKTQVTAALAESVNTEPPTSEEPAEGQVSESEGDKPVIEEESTDAGQETGGAEGEPNDSNGETESPAGEPIPEMSKSAQEPEQEIPSEDVSPQPESVPLQDEQGGEMPIDYQQIIDGLNAKTMALEAENKQLKAKMEGAFGLSSKPGAFTPVNSLYGDTTDIPLMRK